MCLPRLERVNVQQDKLGEIGAGIGLGTSSSSHHSTEVDGDDTDPGANVMAIMRHLSTEMYEDILAHTADPGKPNIRGFRYVFGSEGHEEIYTVRAMKLISYKIAFHERRLIDSISSRGIRCGRTSVSAVYVYQSPA